MRRNLFKLVLATAIILVMIAGGGCNSTAGVTNTTPAGNTPGSTPTIADISVTDSHNLIKENTSNQNFVIIDIRTPEEFASGHLENAILIDYYATEFRDELNKLDKDKQYLVYCRTARRSALAMEIFKELGFMDVLNMAGGITEWIGKGYPIVE